MQRQQFYLTRRTLKSGKRIYYFYFYDKFGSRTVPKSTGCTRRQDAFAYCANLLRRNMLETSRIRFKDYATGFFDEGSKWHNNKVLTKEITPGTLRGYRASFSNHILPYFSEMLLEKITANDIRDFRVYLAEEKELSNKTINNTVDCLRIVFDWAIEDEMIYRSPVTKTIKPLDVSKDREAFTIEEVEYLFSNPWKEERVKLFALTIAMTGMRFSEASGLTVDCIHKDYIDVNKQFIDGEFAATKTKENRFIPIPEELSRKLIEISNGHELVFWRDEDPSRPISRTVLVKRFYSMYSVQMKAEKSDRLLTFHSLRYFLNTYLLANNAPEQKVDFIIGHSDGKGMMRKLYTTWRPEMYSDILELQKQLFNQIAPADVLQA